MTIVMGLDQHRAQITAEWIDTDSGEIGRARVSPALRDDGRQFLARFGGRRLEAALEATTRWRLHSWEPDASGVQAHLAAACATAAPPGHHKRGKTQPLDA